MCSELLEFLAYAIVPLLGFIASTTWYFEARIYEWDYFPEFRIVVGIFSFPITWFYGMCSVGIL